LRKISNSTLEEIGAIAVPEEIYFVEQLPKTRSGKIMRRILLAIEKGEDVGDITTLEELQPFKKIKEAKKMRENI